MHTPIQAVRTNNTPVAFRLLQICAGIIIFLLFAHIVLQYLNLEVFYQQNGQVYELSNRFDFDDEASVPTWVSQASFLAIGVTAAAAAYTVNRKAIKRLWAFIAALGLLLSVDEISGLHEFFLQTIHVLFFKDESPSILANAWLLIAPFIVLAMGWLAWVMIRILPRRTTLLFVISGTTFLVGAIAVDMFTSVAERESFLNQGLYVAIEETLELLANAISLYAIADYLERNHRDKLAGIVSRLQR